MKVPEPLPDDWGREPWRVQLRQRRQDLYPARRDAADASGLSMEVWKYTETGFRGATTPYAVQEVTLAKMARALGLDPYQVVTAAGGKTALIPLSLMEVEVKERHTVTVLVIGKLTDLTADELAAIPDQVAEVLGRIPMGTPVDRLTT